MGVAACLAVFLASVFAPAAIRAAHFYTTDAVQPQDITCQERFSMESISSCALKCVHEGCYNFQEQNGVCDYFCYVIVT